ncbi:competence protein/transcription factor (plasmid) [Lactococcus cremoris]|uniref:hypothetical protein n=1 Tax=Lactococcus lactis subsp. cremoris TaxID=1359 RepID=UPI000DBBAE0E|nr:hypothetical protein [Lactococcus cremoris]BBC77230.1 competence protein/transcription factor [Lactococcus cremoris]
MRGKIIYLQEEIPFGQGRLIEQLRLPFLSQKLLTIPLIVDLKLAEFIRRQLYYCSPKWLKLQEKYYQRGENLLNLTFERSFIAPLGLNLLEVLMMKSLYINLLKLSRILIYIMKLFNKFSENSFKAVYPPRFYAIMKKQKKDMNE